MSCILLVLSYTIITVDTVGSPYEDAQVLKLLLSYITFYSRYGKLIFLSYKCSITCTI